MSEKQQVAISVAVTSVVLVTLLAVLVVALVKLAQFIRTSQTFKSVSLHLPLAPWNAQGNKLCSYCTPYHASRYMHSVVEVECISRRYFASNSNLLNVQSLT